MSEEIKIITLGDIFKNIETEEKAFKFKDYIINLQQENQQLKEALLNIKEFIDKHTKIVKETGTKYLLTNVKDDNKLINIINEILGDKENE